MARSTYIYLVTMTDAHGPAGCQGEPVAAFTVKREMASWLRDKPGDLVARMTVRRMPDNPWMSGGIKVMDIDDIIS